MKYYSVKPVHLALRPSRRLLSLLWVATAGAGVLVALLPMPLWLKAGLGVGMLLAATCSVFRDALLRLPGSVVALEVTSQGRLRCRCRSGEWLDAAVCGDSFVTPWLTVLNLRIPGKRRTRHALVLPDSADGEMFRRLRVWLRWGSQALPDE